jgi:hypothetical protein
LRFEADGIGQGKGAKILMSQFCIVTDFDDYQKTQYGGIRQRGLCSEPSVARVLLAAPARADNEAINVQLATERCFQTYKMLIER